jgi:outer membrane receptor protein involved in Fe transport
LKLILKLIGRSIFIFCFGAIILAIGSKASRAQDAPPPPVPVQQQDTPAPASAPQAPATPPAPAPVTFEISGSARSGKTPLPGVTVTAANTLTGKKYVGATNSEGKFTLSGLARGRYVVRIEFMGFAAFTQEVVLNPENPAARVDAELMLASRQQEQSNNALAALAAAGRGFQSLAMENSLSSFGGTNGDGGAIGNGGGQNNGDVGNLPLNGAGAEGPTESVSVSGAQGRTQDFGMGNEEELQQHIQEFRDRMQREGGGAFGPPSGGGLGGGPGIVMMGRMPRGFNINQPHGVFYYTDDNSGLDARPYSLTGIPTAKADYNQARFGFNAGGPLNIPKIFHGGNKWFFFGGWNGSRGSNPYDAFSTVPTQLERNGDFSQSTYHHGTPVQIFNSRTGQQYQFNNGSSSCAQPCPNVLDPAMITTQAQALLNYIPLPNMPTNAFGQNFHYVTSANSSSDMVMFRLVHNFNAAGGLGGGGPFFVSREGRGGGRRRAQNNLNFGLNWARSSSSIVNPFPSQAGGNSTQGLNASAGWVYGKGRITNNLRVNYNHNHVATTNLYSNVTNVDGLASINGVSPDPFNWGLPGISFTSFGGLSDPTPRRELDQTYTLSATISWNHAKHNFRFGADYRRILQSFHSARNAEGSFVFTGYATSQYASGSTQPAADTGYDFADFLLGFPQQTSLQFGTNSYNFRSSSYDFFAQDDWRFRPSLSFNLGLRYEYNSPYTEANNRIANLDVAPGFTAAVPVLAGGTGPYNGIFPNSLIQPDRNNFAPRVGIAWKPQKKTVVRAGYGINYNLAQYGTMIQNFAFQPPFANTATNTTDVNALAAGNALTLSNGFPTASGTVTNNFAVNPDYRLGYVQIWNLDLQRDLPGGWILSTGYNGAKGTHLDIERALLVAGNQPFTYESSEGNSILHASTVRVRKRMAKGIGLSAQYVYSKSIDDASSIGGGGSVVAQDAFDISADRGLSSFDERHKFTGNWIYDLPIGENRYFSPKGALGHIFGAWQWSGDFTVGSGLYFTPRVLGGALDIGRGVSGSLRANTVAGQTIALGNPTTLEWFNTAAFCAPNATTCVNPSGTAFGDAGRNIIEGPAQFTLNMSVNKTITIKESRALDLRFSANNVFNTVRFTSINTVVNSFTFGEVTGTGGMRRVTMTARFRF